MKKLRKAASLLLALTLALALAIPAFAGENETSPDEGDEAQTPTDTVLVPSEDDRNGTLTKVPGPTEENKASGKITVDNAIVGETYRLYKIFDASYNNSPESYSYTISSDSDWYGFVKGSDMGVAHVELKETGTANVYSVTWKGAEDAATVAKFAQDALAYAQEKSIAPVTNGTKEAETTTVEFIGLSYGYYLIDSSMGALCILNTATPNVTVNEKNDIPGVDKEVQEDNKTDEGWQSTNDAKIGQTVNYKTTVTVQKGAQAYVLHDKMSKGLTFDAGSVVVKVGDTQLTASKEYTLDANPTCGHNVTDAEDTETEDCTFTITFEDSYIQTLTAGTEIVVTYSATLNKDAEIYTNANTNETWLKYGESSNTEKSETKTYTYEFDLVKYTTDDDGNKVLLNGAEFAMYETKEEDGTLSSQISFVYDETTKTYRVATSEDVTTTTTIVVTDGQVKISGLDADDVYYLQETKAPVGYNLAKDPIEVKITSYVPGEGGAGGTAPTVNGGTLEATITTTTNEDGTTTYTNGGVGVVNNTGTQLPSTGGIGTTIFYVVGGVLVIGAGILLVTKKRMSSK